jgi:diguanylate cyclase (GGDEF)-like protein/PAS domain S-box-containing protein
MAVAWPCVAIIGALLVISALSIVALSATRAYVTGNALWARAERDAEALLIGYSRTGDPQSLAQLNVNLQLMLGDRTARIELSKPHPDYALARRGLLAGGNHPADMAGMIWLFRSARLLRAFGEPMRIWAEADDQFVRYLPLEKEIIAARAAGKTDPGEHEAWVQRVQQIHEPLSSLELSFAAAMDDNARRLAYLLLAFLGVSTTVLLISGYVVSHRLLQRAGAMEAALRASQNQVIEEQARAQVLLESISDAVISTDRDGRIEFFNAAAQNLTGWTATEARGLPLATVFRVAPTLSLTDATIQQAISLVLAQGQSRRLSVYGAELIRRDQSTAAIGERAAPLHDHSGNVAGMVLVMRDVSGERKVWDRLRYQADHDALTGLPNRSHFEQCLEMSMQTDSSLGPRFTVMFIDLDEFKAVNDTCGHRAGDELLRQIGSHIQQQLRGGDLLARLGGDEFGVLLPSCDRATALQIAERVRQDVEAMKFSWGGTTHTVMASIGVVLDDRGLPGVADVLGAADRACYAAKKSGRNGICVYDAVAESRRWRVSEANEGPA